MTVGEDFIPMEEEQEFDEPAYPTAFGITLTPPVSGVLVAILGLLGAVFLLINALMPKWEAQQQLKTEITGLEDQVEQKEAQLKNIAALKDDLERAKQKRSDVLSLFASEQTLDTLLLDLNKLIQARNQGLKGDAVKAQLIKFEPVEDESGTINDGSLGEELDNKMKRQVVEVELEGTFAQTRLIMLNIERLQPLLLVEEFESIVDVQRIGLDDEVTLVSPGQEPKITTTFKLQALIPLSDEELAKLEAQNNPNQPNQ